LNRGQKFELEFYEKGNLVTGVGKRPFFVKIIDNLIESRRPRWEGHVTRMGNNKNAYRDLKGKSEGRIPLRTCWCMWQEIKIDLGEHDGKACTGFFWLTIGTCGAPL
jgi:hypothetical protein